MSDWTQPWRLVPNKMNTYGGGRELDRFRGVPVPLDDRRPEGWIGSTTTFRSKAHPRLGHSEVFRPSGGLLYLTDAIQEDPRAMVGDARGFEVLMKLLDAGQDLAFQCHPSREAARLAFDSEYGKAESWIVLGVRPDAAERPHVLLGFREGVSPERFFDLYEARRDAEIEALAHRFDVAPGDVFFVPPGVPHAVHSGCLLAEVQEPSDITVNAVPYRWGTPEINRRHDEALRKSLAFEGRTREETERTLRVRPTALREGAWGSEELLVGPSQTPYFSCTRLSVRSGAAWRPTGRAAACLVVEGSGAIHHPDGSFSLRKADEFFVPAAADDLRFVAGPGGLVVLASHPEGAVHLPPKAG